VSPEQQALNMGGYGHGVGGSVFSPIALALVLLAGLLICILPRSKAIAPFFLAAILIPMNQVVVVGGLHFPMLKFLAIAGIVRVVWAKLTGREKIFSGGVNIIDVGMMTLTVFTAVDGILLWREWGEVVYQMGQIYTPVGLYFLLRFLIQDEEDVKRLLRVWAGVVVAVALVMICEQLTGRNPVLAVLGGVGGSGVEIRDGALRSRGTFMHPILAGTFGGMSLPLFVGLWWKDKKSRTYAVFGAVGAIIIALSANSSTAEMALIAGAVALCFWPLRRYMRAVRWGFVGLCVADELRFKAHFWHLISDIDLTGSSSSWHRYMLLDQCIRHFTSWALVGTKDYGTWGWDAWDLSNQYVQTADTAGLIPLVSFVVLFVFAYKYLGRARQAAEGDKNRELFIWAICAAVFANMLAMFGIDYFDQTMIAWYAILAIVSVVTVGVWAKPVTEARTVRIGGAVPYSILAPGTGASLRRATPLPGRPGPTPFR
jgi:hypothetical protein